MGDLPDGVFAGAPAQTSARPALLASFGPNGTHFPEDADWLGEVSATELEVDCTWEAIIAAITWLTPDRVAAGATIRVRPGELPGSGSGSADKPVLEKVGDPAWEKNVVLTPRDGYGSVTLVDDGIRLNEVSRISLFGFTGDVGVVLTQCTAVMVGWGRFPTLAITLGGADISLYEVVLGYNRNPNDTSAVRPTESFSMTNLERHGCAFGPSVKPAGDDSHCDTLQLERTGEGEFGPMLSVDCIDIASSNSTIQIDDTIGTVEFQHSMILGGSLSKKIFPLESGDYVGDDPNAFSGGALDVRMSDSFVIGAVGRTGFTSVENSVIGYEPQPSQQPSESGEWTVDTSAAEWSLADIEKAAGTALTAEEFTSHWSW